MVNISLTKIAKRGIRRSRSRGMMTCHLTRPVETRQKPCNGWDLYRTRQKHPHACPIRSCCPHSLGWSCLHTLVLTLTLITCRCVLFSYEDIWGGCIFWCKYATCTSNSPGWPCVYALVLNWKDNPVFSLYWSGLNWSKCCKIFHTDQIFLPSVICRSRQDSMSLLSQTFSQVILQLTILHFNNSFSGTSIY